MGLEPPWSVKVEKVVLRGKGAGGVVNCGVRATRPAQEASLRHPCGAWRVAAAGQADPESLAVRLRSAPPAAQRGAGGAARERPPGG